MFSVFLCFLCQPEPGGLRGTGRHETLRAWGHPTERTVILEDLRQPELRRMLRDIAEAALSHTPGPRRLSDDGKVVWNKDVPLYGTRGFPHAGPGELIYAAAASSALVPLLDLVDTLLAELPQTTEIRPQTHETKPDGHAVVETPFVAPVPDLADKKQPVQAGRGRKHA